ncbi:MAG TPA: acyl-CoA dehydrogenase family protein [Leptospiraceae bacterium]|nr:acyl-CoA dehydrogenase family protein [Leptospiraceae bacterium]HMX33250.1 acyl-CoA dehydrogenase family protein [Leptospiraceae bacterium]HMY32853.1 acyl-CoA dehydrogenase family protein [Leptospiraceae bacterium]HMZ66096.1 acyl-CoA dehydrogenase family protein [Leptospiraceae bacterium]HNA07028.1 acyl-CoA dehydrogenase family protein [Leptospiraceae bacterium]
MNDTVFFSKHNPGLAPFDISNYHGVAGRNFFDEDRLLHHLLDKYTKDYNQSHKEDMLKHIRGYGELVGGILNKLTEACHKEGKYGEVIHFDRVGNRIDKVVYSEEQLQSRKISYEYGIVNLDFHRNWKHPFTTLHKLTLAYLANQNGEGGVTCPLAMTDGIILGIKALGTDEQKKKFLPLVAGEHSSSHFMAGQYVTERVGGSNVGANRTVAKKLSNGKWLLNGEKWFCSNPGDLWVTTARIEGTNTIGMFLVPRLKDDGSLNGCYIIRKKDIIGSRGKITVETVYEDLEAEELGRVSHGLANLIKYIIKTSRIHLSLAALGIGRRALMEGAEYVQVREAYGKKVIEFPSIQKQVAEMKILQSACAVTVFKNVSLLDSENPLLQILNPLMKYISSSHATWISKQAILLHGGNGILGDFSCLPRLHNDSIINETWEGTHQVISEHVIKAFKRPKAHNAFFEEIQKNIEDSEKYPFLTYANETLKILKARLDTILNSNDELYIEMNRISLCDSIYNLFALSELICEATSYHKESALSHIANGFAEIAMRGKEGLTDQNGIFHKPEILKWIIEY